MATDCPFAPIESDVVHLVDRLIVQRGPDAVAFGSLRHALNGRFDCYSACGESLGRMSLDESNFASMIYYDMKAQEYATRPRKNHVGVRICPTPAHEAKLTLRRQSFVRFTLKIVGQMSNGKWFDAIVSASGAHPSDGCDYERSITMADSLAELLRVIPAKRQQKVLYGAGTVLVQVAVDGTAFPPWLSCRVVLRHETESTVVAQLRALIPEPSPEFWEWLDANA